MGIAMNPNDIIAETAAVRIVRLGEADWRIRLILDGGQGGELTSPERFASEQDALEALVDRIDESWNFVRVQ